MKSHKRHSQVTDEHLPIDPALLGRPLATAWRRGAAILIDAVLNGFLMVPWLLFCAAVAIWLQAPSLISALRVHGQASEEQREEAWQEVMFEVGQVVASRRPELLPPGVHEALANGDRKALAAVPGRKRLIVSTVSQKRSYYDRSTSTVHLHGDALYGRLAPLFGTLSAALAYFALFTWRLRGRTPGKWLLGVRVVRLDGRPLTLWDAFGRAGGYSASLSTFGLGFLEALWNPNRQTIHDRISGTVVLRCPRKGPSPVEGAKADRPVAS